MAGLILSAETLQEGSSELNWKGCPPGIEFRQALNNIGIRIQ